MNLMSISDKCGSFCVFWLVLFCSSALAQHQVSFSAGYGLAGSEKLLLTQSDLDKGTSKGIYGSFGRGLRIAVGYGHRFSDQISFEVDVVYTLGDPYEAAISSSNSRVQETMHSEFWYVSPSMKYYLVSGAAKKFVPFIKVGPLAGYSTLYSELTAQTDIPQVTRIASEREFTGKLGFGVQGFFGVEWLISPKLSVSFSTGFVSLNYSPTQSEVTRYEINGVDSLDQPIVPNRKIVYVENPSQDGEQFRSPYPLSSIPFDLSIYWKW